MSFLYDAFVYLTAAVIAVPLFRALKLGAVLGYLFAGVVIGPHLLGIVADPTSILHFAEIGVVFLLFIIGLELHPKRLWVLRRTVFGLGAAQFVTTAVVLSLAAKGLGLNWRDAIVIGAAFALSSTAFVIQMLAERGELQTPHGRAAFGVLMFQDIAVAPLLALLPYLAPTQPEIASGPWWSPLLTLATLVVIIVGGRYLLRPAIRAVVHARAHEIFIAATLLLVIGAALAMESLGLSMGLGALVAGVLLSDSEYRHELEVAIEPFKGLLLGLFFLAVGMSLNLDLLYSEPLLALGLVGVLMAIKALLLYVIARIAGRSARPARRLALLLSQGGEFAFVIFGAALPLGLLADGTAQLAVLVVTISLALTPLAAMLDDRMLAQVPDEDAPDMSDEAEPEASPVIIAGIGRTGQVIARLLRAKGIPFTALEMNPEQLLLARRFGNPVFFGDAGHPQVLRTAGAEDARLFVLAINKVEPSVRIARTVRKHFPTLPIYASARNRQHALALREIGATFVMRTALLSSIELSESVLRGLGVDRITARRLVRAFRRHDDENLDRQFAFHKDDDALVQSAHESAEELRLLLEADYADQPDEDELVAESAEEPVDGSPPAN
jgi:glutathione-regulated potassium-efflux system protein KefB